MAKYRVRFLPSAELQLAAAAAPPSPPPPKRKKKLSESELSAELIVNFIECSAGELEMVLRRT